MLTVMCLLDTLVGVRNVSIGSGCFSRRIAGFWHVVAHNSSLSVGSLSLVVLVYRGSRGKVSDGRQAVFSARRVLRLCIGGVIRLASDVAHHDGVLLLLSCGGGGLGMSGRLWQKLFKVFKQVRGRIKKPSDLAIDILYGLRLALVSLQDLQKLLVDVGLCGEAVLMVKNMLVCDAQDEKQEREGLPLSCLRS